VLDNATLALGQFEGTPQMVDNGGRNLVKTTCASVPGGGIFGTDGLLIPAQGAVAIHRTGAFNPMAGTIEMWVKPGPDTTSRQHLFSLRGQRTLDGNGFNDLFAGDANAFGTPAASRLYLGDATGLDVANPSIVASRAPRGVGFGDVDGDDKIDLVIAMNQGQSLPHPITPTPGEIHVFHGPFGKNAVYLPVQVIEADLVQGLVLGDFDKDGDLDIMVTSFVTDLSSIIGFQNDGAGNFTLMNLPYGKLVGAAEGLAADDVNGDGILDVLYGSLDMPPSRVLLGAIGPGGYTFQDVDTTSSARANQSLGASLGDLDGDGLPDSVLAQPLFDNGPGAPAGRVVVHFNDGTGHYADDPDAVIVSPRPFTVTAVRDLNNDGHLDITVANWRDGLMATPWSTVYFGPLPKPAPGSGTVLNPPSRQFKVPDAVSFSIGDLDNDGLDDLFFHSCTALFSPVFLLDADGHSKAGADGLGHELPSYLLPSQASAGAPGGDGVGVCVALSGTSPYGSVLDRSNSLDLYVENDELHFEVTDWVGAVHAITAPLPGPFAPGTVNGYHHVQAEWQPLAGVLELRVGDAGEPGNVYTHIEPQFRVTTVSPVFRLGTDRDNQFPATGWMLDDVRLSSLRRSQLDLDGDQWPDDWDICPATFNPNQADSDDDGIGDACAQCQQGLGFQGPGALQLSVCGQSLASCSSAMLWLHGAPAGMPFIISISLGLNPLPFHGGTLVTLPPLLELSGGLDGNGAVHLAVPGGLPIPDIFMQARALDLSVPGKITISNAVQLHFLP